MFFFIGQVCSYVALGMVMFGLGRENKAITVSGQIVGVVGLLFLSLPVILNL